jgi:hypothetical protein
VRNLGQLREIDSKCHRKRLETPPRLAIRSVLTRWSVRFVTAPSNERISLSTVQSESVGNQLLALEDH